MSAFISSRHLEKIVSLSLEEDMGQRGDLTTQATITSGHVSEFNIVSRSNGIFCGIVVAEEILRQVDQRLQVSWMCEDGDRIEHGQKLASISGPSSSIMTAERTVLNFLGRLSGIASLTRNFVDAVLDTPAAITHTRKTTPGLRSLEIYAVQIGGGSCHRFGLHDAILIKDNHICLCGSVTTAIERAKAYAGHMTHIAVEVDCIDQLHEALEARPHSILLDNFSLSALCEAVKIVKNSVALEASGGVTLSSVRAIAQTGVNVISIGELTHSVKNFDLALDAV